MIMTNIFAETMAKKIDAASEFQNLSTAAGNALSALRKCTFSTCSSQLSSQACLISGST